jgi:CopG family transcriptional regulator / antitoxin EndoAI
MPAKRAAKTARPAKKTAPRPRRSKVYTISLPPELAARAEAIAKEESRTMSEVFRETLRAYDAQRIVSALREAAAYGATRNLAGYTEQDAVRMVKETRAATKAEKMGSARKAVPCS